MSGILVTFVFLVNINSMSWFTDKIEGDFSVTSATQEDIISSITIKELSKPLGVMEISVETTGTVNPYIYFEVTGDIYDYIQHINPIKASDYNVNIGKSYIYPKLSLPQFTNLCQGSPVVKGKFVVRAFNGYIVDERDIQFDKKTLFSVYLYQIFGDRSMKLAASDG